MSNLAMMMGLGSGAGGVAVADVFSTYLYTGNGSTQTITNGIDLAGEGGLVWTKGRNNTNYHYLIDTERGAGKFLFSNDTSAQAENIASISSFNSDGYVLGNLGGLNGSPDNYVSWTWRKAAGFFDVVAYDGNGVSGRAIDHNLNSDVGMIIVKSTTLSGTSWRVFHRSLGATQVITLNSTSDAGTSSSYWADTEPTSTQFTIGNVNDMNNASYKYVAYLFAHNEDLIQCGSYTGASPATVDLGWQPQWIMIKRTSGSGDWVVFDTARGLGDGNEAYLYANTSATEASNQRLTLTATGFETNTTDYRISSNGETYIYVAIKAED